MIQTIKNNKIIYVICYIIGMLLSILGCYYLSSFISAFAYISFGILGYRLIKTTSNMDKAPAIFCNLFLICIMSLVLHYVDKKQKIKELDQYGSIITIAIIDNVYNYRGYSGIDCHYKTISDLTLSTSILCSENISKSKNVNDTILIRYSRLSHNKYFVYNYFPTHEEIQEFKKGKPYEPKKQKNK